VPRQPFYTWEKLGLNSSITIQHTLNALYSLHIIRSSRLLLKINLSFYFCYRFLEACEASTESWSTLACVKSAGGKAKQISLVATATKAIELAVTGWRLLLPPQSSLGSYWEVENDKLLNCYLATFVVPAVNLLKLPWEVIWMSSATSFKFTGIGTRIQDVDSQILMNWLTLVNSFHFIMYAAVWRQPCQGKVFVFISIVSMSLFECCWGFNVSL